MDLRNFAGYIAGLVVVIAILSAVLIPVINDSTDGDPLTYRNDSGVYVNKSEPGGAIEISKAADSSVVAVNSETKEPDGVSRTLLAMPGCSVALARSTDSYVVLINDTVNNKYVMVTAAQTLALTISDSVCSYSVDGTASTLAVADDYYYYSSDGEYAMVPPSSGVYVQIDDYVAYTQVSRHTYWYTSGGIYDNVAIDDSLSADITYETMPDSEGQMDYVTGATINGITAYVSFAPRETTIQVNEMESGLSTILYVIPVLVLVAILLSAVALIRNRE